MGLLFGLPGRIDLAPGLVHLPGFASDGTDILAAVGAVLAMAPARRFPMRGGRRIAVAMSNCGALGWISDETGYRYGTRDPETGRPWPAMPTVVRSLAAAAAEEAGFADFSPEACLINLYGPNDRMGLHQDRDEAALDQPIVSLSWGLSCRFSYEEPACGRAGRRAIILRHGDALVFGAGARLMRHGVDRILADGVPLDQCARLNLTFRRVTAVL